MVGLVSVLSMLACALLISNWYPEFFPQSRHSSVVSFVTEEKQSGAFYRNLLLAPDNVSSEFLLPDPEVVERAVPLYPVTGMFGPHDVLGFRNLFVPAVADVVVIGDSQTYGNNVVLEKTWPQVLSALTGKRVYSMATGGWGGVQYRYMFEKAQALRPDVIVVAFYTGNDAYESFYTAYGLERWQNYRFDKNLVLEDLPEVVYPPSQSEVFRASLSEGKTIAFTPALRLASNEDNRAIDAGYRIMEKVVEEMSALAIQNDIRLLITLIPTKELAWFPLLEKNNIQVSGAFRELVHEESRRKKSFIESVSAMNVEVMDMTATLQQAVLAGGSLYPVHRDGHMLAPGYRIVAEAVSVAIVGQEER